MIWILLFIIVIPILSIIIYIIIRSRRGYLVAIYLKSFEDSFDENIVKNKSKSDALYNAFNHLRNCAILNKMKNNDVKNAVQILSKAYNPKKLVKKIMITFNLTKALQAFKDTNFLQELVNVEFNESENNIEKLNSKISEKYIQNTEVSNNNLFIKANELVELSRMLAGIIEPKILKKYPILKQGVNYSSFTIFFTISFVTATCVRLHFEVEEKLRTPLENTIKNELMSWYKPSIEEFHSLSNFIKDKLTKEKDRKKRERYIFILCSEWMINRIFKQDEFASKFNAINKITEEFADIFQNETNCYWIINNV